MEYIQHINLKIYHNNWIKKNTNVLGSRTAMELKGIPMCLFRKNIKKKEKIVVYHDRLEEKLQN